MNEHIGNNTDQDEPPVALKDLISKIQLPADLERRSRAAGRAAYVIDRMRWERQCHRIAERPLDRYLRGLAELAGVALDEVQAALALPAWDQVTAATAPLLARVARLIGLPADETGKFTRWTYLGCVDPERSDAILATHRGEPQISIEDALRQQEECYSEEQRAEVARIIEAIRSEYAQEG